MDIFRRDAFDRFQHVASSKYMRYRNMKIQAIATTAQHSLTAAAGAHVIMNELQPHGVPCVTQAPMMNECGSK